MQEISHAQGLAIAARALIVFCKVRDKRYPVLAEVMALDKELGADMSFHGYTEFTPELLQAMVLKRVEAPSEEPKLLRSKQINNFMRRQDAEEVL